MTAAGIRIKGLSFGYSREHLFRDLDLALEAGNIYGLLGKNGAGKTTLLKLICGLRLPQLGECEVLGYPPQNRPAGLLEEIYFLPEEFYVPALSPELYLALYAPFYPRFDREAFEEYRREFELGAAKKLSELSYGQKKKFLLAFGLASGCRLLLLDEPTNGLDIPSKSQFRKLLARAGDDQRIILISTHQVRDMENLIDPIIILDEGSIIFNQPLFEVSRRLHMELEAGEPAPEEVLYADKTLGGYIVVRENTRGEEARVDLETLFNTVIANRDRVAALFGREA
ncbi:MAG: ABC transporter ATP-binding protein [Spirochaetales bacterium]|nr:ABC transporter ATP-binding protein [Spirochaetales bacterium]